MPFHQETRILPYTADQMFAIVADIESYPKFLPWCSRLVVRKRDKQGAIEFVTAEMSISYHALQQRYVSRVKLDPAARTIEARHVEGPFRRLDTNWRFVPLEKGSEVHFKIDFAFSNPLLSAVANVAFGYVSSRMTEAFVTRAAALYGSEDLEQ
ncbi:MAG TPA: type II toxin-antitoxin system RatA family toxin [Micropepsaceae bacterium]|jgi:coenzyme Q-binding protein COQ10|nr:type II toxin-antitoxin system RatA family toxin [Micropepsaceae bacterium]